MPTLGTGLAIGKSALRAQQFGLNLVGNNIANVNTPGYSRKAALIKVETAARTGVAGGVKVDGITRQRSTFLDSQARFQSNILGRLDAKQELMGVVESIFTELAGGGASETNAIFNQPGGAALSGGFSRFFNAFQDLANNPQSQAGRAQVREEASFIIQQFKRMADKLSELRNEIDIKFKSTVRDINRLTEDIGQMNARILAAKAKSTDVAGNLDDERDRLIDELSFLIDTSVRENTDGTLTVTGATGAGVLLVDGANVVELGTRGVIRDGASVSDLTLAATGEVITVASGKLRGLTEVRDQEIVSYKQSLDELATKFVERVNAVHSTGFGSDGSTGNDFFAPAITVARDIALSVDIADNLDKIATASPSADNANISAGLGDGSIAQAIADLATERSLGGGTQSFEEFYADLQGRIGAEALEVINDFEGQGLVMQQISNRRENVRGVSINEEASDLILFQRGYQAAARIITTIDEMMQTALNM